MEQDFLSTTALIPRYDAPITMQENRVVKHVLTRGNASVTVTRSNQDSMKEAWGLVVVRFPGARLLVGPGR